MDEMKNVIIDVGRRMHGSIDLKQAADTLPAEVERLNSEVRDRADKYLDFYDEPAHFKRALNLKDDL